MENINQACTSATGFTNEPRQVHENSSHGVVSLGRLTAHSGELIYDGVVCKVPL